MAGRVTRAAGLAAVLFAASAQAATVTFKTSETSGRTLDSVVVTLLPVGKVALPPPRPASIEQVRKAFVPLVSVVQTGAAVDFPNKDTVRHHVYSFSASKVFELKLYAGTPARPVVFDKPGVVVLGCNIHDKMVAYIMVVDTPWFAVTGDDGSARIADLPPGDYMLRAWHPRRLGMPDLPPRPIKVSADMTESVTVDLTP
ncbi:MAG: methylamine utilization protein [Methyloversatilis sp. 12-65-5]|nr:MAG: methylamine utilization protein [Methyloversatilis sp. 12-65-5]